MDLDADVDSEEEADLLEHEEIIDDSDLPQIKAVEDQETGPLNAASVAHFRDRIMIIVVGLLQLCDQGNDGNDESSNPAILPYWWEWLMNVRRSGAQQIVQHLMPMVSPKIRGVLGRKTISVADLLPLFGDWQNDQREYTPTQSLSRRELTSLSLTSVLLR